MVGVQGLMAGALVHVVYLGQICVRSTWIREGSVLPCIRTHMRTQTHITS